MSARTKEIAKAVDDCLTQLIGSNTQINLTATLLEKWEIAVRKITKTKLSPRKVEVALKKMGIQVKKITECADNWMCDRGWKELNLS
jgi:DNA-binding HxlR family transcriptional regulator